MAILGLTVAASFAAVGLQSGAAIAAPGDAFDPARPTIFIAQGDPTQLSVATPDADGNFSFVNQGPGAPLTYNGIGFNEADNYLYGFVHPAGDAEFPAGALVRIGQDNAVTRVGSDTFGSGGGFNVGAFGPGGLMYAASTTDAILYVIDVTTGAEVEQVSLDNTMNSYGSVSDWTFSQGFLWGYGDGKTLVRVNPTTGAVDSWNLDFAITSTFAGAVWTYSDGSIGLSHNATGQVNRIAISNPDGATPTFSLVSSRSGPASSLNDGAAIPGLPADLALAKTSTGLVPGGTVTYTLEVTNNGDGWSTGWTLTDEVPAPLTGITAASDDASCEVAAQSVSCVSSSEFPPGESRTVTVTAEVPADFTGSLENSAEVVGNESDPNPANNNASVVDQVADPIDPTEPTDPQGPVVPESPLVNAGGEGVLASSSGMGAEIAFGSGLALLAAVALGAARRFRKVR